MRIPYVIDNQKHRMADVLNCLLTEHKGRSLDVASAYFTVSGFQVLREGLSLLGNMRLLLGAEPRTGDDLGLSPKPSTVRGRIKGDLNELAFSEETLRLVEDLIAFLRKSSVQVRLYEKGFLHAKCWLFYADEKAFGTLYDRFIPLCAIVGSSNFTRFGLTSNRELNLSHKVLLDPGEVEDEVASRSVEWLSGEKPSVRIKPESRHAIKSEVGARAILELEEWFRSQWSEARDYRQDLIDLLDESKFGEKEYTPYQVYMKALYSYFRGELDQDVTPDKRSAVELAEFQEHAVKKARRMLARYDGLMVADSVGLGKTWVGKKLMEDYAYHMRQKALLVCPASLRSMWERELKEAAIAAEVLSQELLGQQDFEPGQYGDADVILIDESHNFRNRNSQRYENLNRIIAHNAGRGRDGKRKKVILLTATPVNNDLMDLYNQIALITQGDRSYFAAAGIGDLYRYFLNARRENRKGNGVLGLFNLLEEVVIRRTRHFIRKAYPEATIQGKKVSFPDRELRTLQYDLEDTYAGLYDSIVGGIEGLKLAPYHLEAYKRAGVEVNEMEEGREMALVGIFKSRYLKRLESSIHAFRISIRRALAFLKTFESYVLDGKVLKSPDFQKAVRYLEREDEEDDATPKSQADELDANEEAREFLSEMRELDRSQYDLRRLHKDVQNDVETLTDIWRTVKDIGPEKDLKLAKLKAILKGDLCGRKVLIFSYYKDTARYLYSHLGHPDHADAQEFRAEIGNAHVRRMDSGAATKERDRIVQAFAPKANNREDLRGTEKEIDILISTDVLSEGQNLQDCGTLINYDLHWNPTRMVQRAGRIDRIGTDFNVLHIYNMFPDEGLEKLLRLVESMTRKIEAIDSLGMLDASVLGEEVHPRVFNTLRRIRDEDGSVLDEEEQFTELASSEFLLQQLQGRIQTDGREDLEELPDGIHSGLVKQNAKGVFFYFTAGRNEENRQHFWRYLDLTDTGRVLDNRYLIANLIQCERETPRVVDPDLRKKVFEYQEEVIEDILRSVRDQAALEAAPRMSDPIQQIVTTILQNYLNSPNTPRKETLALIRYLNTPMLPAQIKTIRKALKDFDQTEEFNPFFQALQGMQQEFGAGEEKKPAGRSKGMKDLAAEDLRLVCFDFLSGG